VWALPRLVRAGIEGLPALAGALSMDQPLQTMS
jgi:hypothetical protein